MSDDHDEAEDDDAGGDGYPSAKSLAGLTALRDEPDAGRRSAGAWRLLAAASGNADFAVLLDYAVEHGLVLSLEAVAESDGGQAPNAVWPAPDDSEMVWIPAGPFVVGADDRPATAPGFSLGRHPVTNAQFSRFLDETGYRPPADHPEPDAFLRHWAKGKPPRKQEDHPVVWVSFLDAVHYCRWAGLTLPTEWLWEKAARGPEGRHYPWGDAYPLRKPKLAHVDAAGTVAVGSHPRTRSPYGCEDLIGNVSEWCQTTPNDDPAVIPPAQPDGRTGFGTDGPLTYAVARGSCYLRNTSKSMAAFHRRRLSIYRRNHWTGFRPAALLPCRPA